MAKILDRAEDKIKKICTALKEETLQPARSEAERIIEEAKKQAKEITARAEQEAEATLEKGKAALEKERSVFETSLRQAMVQFFESVKQRVQKSLFDQEIKAAVDASASNPEVIAKLLSALVEAIEREGTAASVHAVIPAVAKPSEITALLGEKILKRLEGEDVVVGDFSGGAKVTLKEQKLTLDLSDEVLREALGRYLREDFRKLLFQG